MFFDQEYLLSKRAGLRVAWLASTLGSQARKLTRRDFTAEDVPTLCQTLKEPPKPIALRTSGVLMLGVAQIYRKQAEYWIADVTTQYNTLRRFIMEGSGRTKELGGLVILGKDTATIDMPGRGRQHRDAVTLPARFDPFLGHSYIESQWGSVEPEGVQDRITASLPSIFSGSQLSSARSARNSSSSVAGKYTLPPSEIHRQPRGTSSTRREYYEDEEEDILLGGDKGSMALDLGLEAEFGTDLLPTNDMDFDMPLEEGDRHVFDLVEELTGQVHPRSSSPGLQLPESPRKKRIKFALADSSIDLSDEAITLGRDNYAENMLELRRRMIGMQLNKKAHQTASSLNEGPGVAYGFAPLATELSSMCHSILAALKESHTIGDDADSRVARSVWEYQDLQPDMEYNNDPMPYPFPEVSLGETFMSSSPVPGNEVGRGSGSQSSENIPWFQSPRPQIGLETTAEDETTSMHSARSFALETPTGLRRSSQRQSSIGAASIGAGGPGEAALGDVSALSGSQDIVDAEIIKFLSYAQMVRDELPEGQPLFFSDLAPVASSSRHIAARAFYNTLALATVKKIQVEQQSAYNDIELVILLN